MLSGDAAAVTLRPCALHGHVFQSVIANVNLETTPYLHTIWQNKLVIAVLTLVHTYLGNLNECSNYLMSEGWSNTTSHYIAILL